MQRIWVQKVSENMADATVGRWFAGEGDILHKGDHLPVTAAAPGRSCTPTSTRRGRRDRSTGRGGPGRAVPAARSPG